LLESHRVPSVAVAPVSSKSDVISKAGLRVL
jgi:hypothetical protein